MADAPGSFLGDPFMTPEEIASWVTAGKSALDLMRSAWQAMPKGEKRDALEEKVKKAETALQTSNAALAKSLGYKLCYCTFPPQIMLWELSEGTNICPACGTKNPAPIERAPGKACPRCGAPTFRVTNSMPHTVLGGILGARVHWMKCDQCGFTDQQIPR